MRSTPVATRPPGLLRGLLYRLARLLPGVLALLALSGCQTAGMAVGDDPHAGETVDRAAFYQVYQRGTMAELSGDFEGAIEAYRAAAVMAPDSVFVHRMLARTLMREHQLQEAEEVLREALERRPDAAELHMLLADILAHTNRQDEAVRSYQNTVEHDPRNLFALRKLVVILLNERDCEQAIPVLEQLIQVDLDFTHHHRRELANCHMTQHQYEEAVRQLEVFIEVQPDGDAWYDLGLAYLRLGHLEQARDAMQASIALKPFNFQAHHILGDLAFQEDKRREALQHYQRSYSLATQTGIRHANALRQIGLVFYSMRDFDKALAYLLEYSKAGTLEEHVVIRVANCFAELERYEEGAQTLEQWRDLNPDKPILSIILSQLYLRWNKPEQSLAAMSELLSATDGLLTPDQRAQAWVDIGVAYSEAGHVDSATSAFHHAIEHAPGYTQGHMALASQLFQAGHQDAAIEAIRQALDGELADFDAPQRAVLLRHLGRMYYQMRDYDRSVEALRQAHALDKHGVEDALLLAHVLMRSRDYEGSVATMREMLADAEVEQTTSTKMSLHAAIARAYIKQKRYDDAIQEIQGILPMAPPEMSLRLRLEKAYALAESGEVTRAIEIARKMVDDFPDSPDALNFLGYMYAEQSIQLDEAEDLIKKALVLAPENGNIVDSLGWVYYQKGQYEKAVVELERAIELSGGDPIMYDHLGDALYRLERVQEAIDNWESAIEHGNERPDEIRDKINDATLRHGTGATGQDNLP